MQQISLEQLLEAGCHFGHKAERWHPKAAEFIWAEKDGIHIIDLAKTKAGLDSAMEFVRKTAAQGETVLFVGSKRQARGVVKEAAQNAGAPYLVQRWIGGFMTNWEGVSKNIQKINKMMADQASGAWKKKFPKHEQTKLARYLDRLNVDYEGVLKLAKLPSAIVVVDVRKEHSAVREAIRIGIPIIGIVDTNADPSPIAYQVPANDDAVGSVSLIISALADAYREGKEQAEKELAQSHPVAAASPSQKKADVPVHIPKSPEKDKKPEVKAESKSKKKVVSAKRVPNSE